MIENPYYSPEMQGPYELFSLGDFFCLPWWLLRIRNLTYFRPPSGDCVRLSMSETAALVRVWMTVASDGSEGGGER